MKGTIFSANFLDNVNCLVYSKNVIHHSHINGDIIGYSHRLGSWRTRNISIGGTNLVNINFANIVNQLKFIETLKYSQQSLSVLATTMTDREKQSIKKECEKFIKSYTKLN